jgi:hypothetical protein
MNKGNRMKTYDIIIPLEDHKHVSLKFIQNENNEWICTMSDECKKDLERILPCKTHPDAPHKFDRNASHSEDRYVGECEYWEPEPWVKTYCGGKPNYTTKPEPFAWAKFRGGNFKTFYRREIQVFEDEKLIPLYTTPSKREWVGLTEEEFFELLGFDGRLDHVEVPIIGDLIRAVQSKLKEKNK